ncbi:uncharacterized protein TNCV_2595581 [Trichonephila clavipes]|nr:uncharacterized protein TNCV_2595581 [Trichonephila clavipes]
MVRREREEEKGERVHRVTCVISVKKLGNCPRLRLVNLPTFRLGVLFPPEPGTLSTVGSVAVDDLRTPVAEQKNILPEINLEDIKECYNCRQSLSRKSIPNLSKYNSFVYPDNPAYPPTLGLVSEKLNSPRIPFMQIRRLRHVHGQFGILEQIINVPTSSKKWYWARTRDKASHGPIPIPLGYRGHRKRSSRLK